jgi:hypothetical protein
MFSIVSHLLEESNERERHTSESYEVSGTGFKEFQENLRAHLRKKIEW